MPGQVNYLDRTAARPHDITGVTLDWSPDYQNKQFSRENFLLAKLHCTVLYCGVLAVLVLIVYFLCVGSLTVTGSSGPVMLLLLFRSGRRAAGLTCHSTGLYGGHFYGHFLSTFYLSLAAPPLIIINHSPTHLSSVLP